MKYEVLFEDAATEDLSDILLYEATVLRSTAQAKKRLASLANTIREDLSEFPDRHAEKPYGFTETLRRKHEAGKYAVFYWVDEHRKRVYIDRIAYSKADFNRIHFGN